MDVLQPLLVSPGDVLVEQGTLGHEVFILTKVCACMCMHVHMHVLVEQGTLGHEVNKVFILTNER